MPPTVPTRRVLAALLLAPALALAACADTPAPLAPDVGPSLAEAAGAAPVRTEFQKCPSGPGEWQGTVSGDVGGDLTTVLLEAREAGPILHVRFDWIIDADDPARSLVADLSGTLNTRTGRVVMNGRVAEGYLQGARVHEEGQLLDPATFCFAGTIRIMPATSR